MLRINTLKKKRSINDKKRDLKIRSMEQEIEKAADVGLGCYEKDNCNPVVLPKSKNTMPVLGSCPLYMKH